MVNPSLHVKRVAVVALFLVALTTSCWRDEPGYTGNAEGRAVGMVGDSMIIMASDRIHAELDPTYAVRILALLGQPIRTMQDFATDISVDNPPIVVIGLGTNDAWSGVPIEQSIADLDQMVAKFPEACIVMPSVNTHVPMIDPPYDNAVATLLNVAIAERADVVADWDGAASADPALYLNPEDGIHPTDAGKELIAVLLREAIDSGCPPGPAESVSSVVSDVSSSALGASVTFTVTVSGDGGVPSGSVTFSEGALVFGVAPLVDGTASLTTAELGGGSHGVVAAYSGDTAFGASVSNPVVVIVDLAPVTVTASVVSMVWGDPVPVVDGGVEGAVAPFAVAEVSCGVEPSAPITGPGMYATVCEGPTNDANYIYTYLPGILTVTEPPVD